MKTKILIFSENGNYFGSAETYFVENLIKAYKAIGYTAEVAPSYLQEQAGP
jgi:hypothetical protein